MRDDKAGEHELVDVCRQVVVQEERPVVEEERDVVKEEATKEDFPSFNELLEDI